MLEQPFKCTKKKKKYIEFCVDNMHRNVLSKNQQIFSYGMKLKVIFV